jgi:hypothetical protein
VNMLKYVIHLTVYIYDTERKELCKAEICFCCQHFAQQDAFHQNLYTHYKLKTDKNTISPEYNFTCYIVVRKITAA